MKLYAVLLPMALAVAGSAAADAPAKHDPGRIEIAITRSGFDPGNVTVPAKTPVTLVFTRKTDATCTKTVVLTMDDGKTIERELPLDKPVELAVTFTPRWSGKRTSIARGRSCLTSPTPTTR